MNAIQFLKQEHEQAKRVFAQIQAASGAERGELWAKLKPELEAHEQREESALYGPVARDPRADETLKEWDAHHRDEVAEAEDLIQEIDELDPADADWMDKVGELHETLEHHIEEEEGEIWPKIQQTWDQAKLEQAGEQMEGLKGRSSRQAA